MRHAYAYGTAEVTRLDDYGIARNFVYAFDRDRRVGGIFGLVYRYIRQDVKSRALEHDFRSEFVHTDSRSGNAAARVRYAAHFHHALQRAILAEHTVHAKQRDVYLVLAFVLLIQIRFARSYMYALAVELHALYGVHARKPLCVRRPPRSVAVDIHADAFFGACRHSLQARYHANVVLARPTTEKYSNHICFI